MLLVPGASGGSATQVVSATIFTVPAAVVVGDLVYLTGADTADRADNTSETTTPARGIVLSKPTSTTAILVTSGEVSGFSGLTPGANQFLGTAGGLIESVAALIDGNFVQRVGEAINATTLLFQPQTSPYGL